MKILHLILAFFSLFLSESQNKKREKNQQSETTHHNAKFSTKHSIKQLFFGSFNLLTTYHFLISFTQIFALHFVCSWTNCFRINFVVEHPLGFGQAEVGSDPFQVWHVPYEGWLFATVRLGRVLPNLAGCSNPLDLPYSLKIMYSERRHIETHCKSITHSESIDKMELTKCLTMNFDVLPDGYSVECLLLRFCHLICRFLAKSKVVEEEGDVVFGNVHCKTNSLYLTGENQLKNPCPPEGETLSVAFPWDGKPHENQTDKFARVMLWIFKMSPSFSDKNSPPLLQRRKQGYFPSRFFSISNHDLMSQQNETHGCHCKKNLLNCLQLTCRNSQEASVVTPTILQE
ncbi:putative signal peptide protein [Puccinia sorghi]|uniref:Putative signal peptide protein n=1 Tax=Puccinia sorghi TaxID=27349 RepID=A0A0L6VJ01_9BASI|nr:putative signal peptide protein [Puccinia sorghi]